MWIIEMLVYNVINEFAWTKKKKLNVQESFWKQVKYTTTSEKGLAECLTEVVL